MYYIDDNINGLNLEAAIMDISEQRRSQAMKFKHELGRRQCVASYLLLKEALSSEYGIEENPLFDYLEGGKPVLRNNPDIQFPKDNTFSKYNSVITILDAQLGIKPIKNKKEKNTMATSTTKANANVYQKLLKARATFLKSEVTKSGKNMHLAFKYFELDDIVPKATAIFEDIGLVPIVKFDAETAIMVVYNVDDPTDSLVFTLPLVQLSENKGTNAVQAFGATVTYYRRYLYMIALDICEPDEIDNGLKNTTAPTVTPTPTAAPTPVDTPTTPSTVPLTAPSKPLTNADGNASEIQIKQLKEVLKKLKDTDPSKEEMITKIALETKGFTVISKADCEALTIKIGEMLKGGQ